MNVLDKFDLKAEIFLNRHFMCMSDEKNLRSLMMTFATEKPHLIPFILAKFGKQKCETCDGRGFIDQTTSAPSSP
jgi:hypothetical protein